MSSPPTTPSNNPSVVPAYNPICVVPAYNPSVVPAYHPSVVPAYNPTCFRCDDIRKQEMWAKTYAYLISAYPDLADVTKIGKICKVYLSLKYYVRVARLLVSTGHICTKKAEQGGEAIMGPGLHDAVLGKHLCFICSLAFSFLVEILSDS